MKTGLLIGNSSGIGLEATVELLKQGWRVYGISRSESTVSSKAYSHFVADVEEDEYPILLRSVLDGIENIDCCIYCAGIGEILDPSNMEQDLRIFNVNLMGMVKTAITIIPRMVTQGQGHFIGISSVADSLLSPEAPSYHATKAAFSNYLESLSLAMRHRGIHVTNIRYGFVDTKMAKGDKKPFMIDVHRATYHLLQCIEKKPMRRTAPRIVIPLVRFRDRMLRWSKRTIPPI